MNPTAIYSKSGKGVQEASGKTSILPRADRAVLSAIDGRATLGEVAQKCGKAFDGAFEALIAKLDKDGFVREASPGIAPPAPKVPPKPAAKPPAKPGAKPAAGGSGEDLDFSANLDFSSASTPKAKAPAPPASLQGTDPRASAEAEKRAQEHAGSLVRARQEAEERAQKERDKAKAEAEAKLRAEAEAKLRAEVEAKVRAETASKGHADIEAKLRAESDAKVKAARDAAVRAAADAKAKAEAEMKATLDAERKAREEAERKAKAEAERVKQEAERARKEAEEKAAREAEELRRKLDEERARAEAERKAREETERKARAEADRLRREAEEKARAEAEAMRKQLEEERRQLEEERKREAEQRKRREEEDRKRREAEDRQRRDDDERRRREEDERKRRDAEERKRHEAEERERAEAKERRETESHVAKAAAETSPRLKVPPPPPPAADAGASGNFDAGLLADLDSFGKNDEEEARAKEEAERKERAAAERRAREESEREAREAAERKRREEDGRRRQEEEARRAREEEERHAREEEEREQRAAEERRRAKDSKAAVHAKAPADDDIGVTDDDLDMDDVKQDERAISAGTRRQAHEHDAREREGHEREALRTEPSPHMEAPEIIAPRARRKPIKWGKALGISLVVLVVAGLGVLQLMPLSSSDYEKAASAALGRPVRIASAHLSVFSGMRVALRGVVIDDVKLGEVNASPELGSVFGERKVFNRIDLEAPALPPALAAAALFGKAKTGNFAVRRLVVHKLKLQGTLALPPLDVDLAFGDDGALRSGTISGPDNLNVALTPKGEELEFELNSGQFVLPIAPEITLNTFGMKGTATPEGLRVTSWDAAMFDGRISGTANLRWGSTWATEGTLAVHGINGAVFAPTLLVEGKADGTGRFSASGPDPEKLGAAARVEGNFTVGRGVLGSVDISRAIQSGGRGATGSTPFSEINGQGVYEKGAVSLRNVNVSAGSMNAGVALDVAANGALSGRIVADVKTSSATLRATVNLGGTVKEPQVR